jgi:hypothetical protein
MWTETELLFGFSAGDIFLGVLVLLICWLLTISSRSRASKPAKADPEPSSAEKALRYAHMTGNGEMLRTIDDAYRADREGARRA